MSGTAQQLSSGLESYDVVRWKDWAPRFDRVRLGGSLQSLRQLVPNLAQGINAHAVPAVDQHVMVFWEFGAPEFEFRISRSTYRRPLPAWAAMLLPGGTESWWATPPPAAHGVFHVHLDPGVYETVASETCEHVPPLVPQIGLVDPGLTGLAQMIYALADDAPRSSGLVWDSCAIALALRLAQLGTRRYRRPHRGNLAPWQTRRCNELLNARLGEDISLAELAAQAGLSQYHFCRAFKQSTGLPPHAYQRRLRVEKARELLATTNLPIIEIASIVGYETPQAFARMFRAQTGASPSDYRRELQA